MKSSFDEKYPHIARLIQEHSGWIELGCDQDSPIDSMIKAIDCGGMLWAGKKRYENIDAALQDADNALSGILKDIYGN